MKTMFYFIEIRKREWKGCFSDPIEIRFSSNTPENFIFEQFQHYTKQNQNFSVALRYYDRAAFGGSGFYGLIAESDNNGGIFWFYTYDGYKAFAEKLGFDPARLSGQRK